MFVKVYAISKDLIISHPWMDTPRRCVVIPSHMPRRKDRGENPERDT